LVAYRSGSRVDVLGARHDIGPADKVTAEDFSVARAASDGAAVVEASRPQSYVGAYAARVTGVTAAGGGSDQVTVTLLLADSSSGTVAQLASAGQLAVAKLPDSVRPPVDLKTK